MATESTPEAPGRPASVTPWSPAWLLRFLAAYPRRNPLTVGYLALIAAGFVVLTAVLDGATADRVKLAISTNPHNMAHDPVFVLLVSPLVSATDSGWMTHLAIIGGGVGVCLALLERRIGSARALGVLYLGNTLATAVATSVAAVAIHSGRYPAEWWSGYDYGISYAVFTVAGAVTVLLPRRWRGPWIVVVLLTPFNNVAWYGMLPGFDAIGHLTGSLLGLGTGIWLVRRRAARQEGEARAQ